VHVISKRHWLWHWQALCSYFDIASMASGHYSLGSDDPFGDPELPSPYFLSGTGPNLLSQQLQAPLSITSRTHPNTSHAFPTNPPLHGLIFPSPHAPATQLSPLMGHQELGVPFFDRSEGV
jgi:hypothetical protein